MDGVDDGVPGKEDLVAADAFGGKVGPVDLRRSEAQIGHVVGDHERGGGRPIDVSTGKYFSNPTPGQLAEFRRTRHRHA